jgi:hypothetical protein
MAEKKNQLTDLLSDRFSDIWQLLSETTSFLSRTPLFHHYENQLREWRLELQRSRRDLVEAKHIRTELVELRKSLRLQGYDLSLAKQQIVFDGFRNDTALGQGFRRAVIFFSDDDVYFLSGSDNHIQLAQYLEERIEHLSLVHRKRINIRRKHYVWYRRDGPTLTLSGSDTESKDDYETLKAVGEANSLLLLKQLKTLR